MVKWRNSSCRDHLEDLGSINMDLQKIGRREVDWFDLAQERDKWQAVGNSVMELQLP
jgi:hypothetical protein